MLDKGFMFSEISVDSDMKKSIKTAVKHFEMSYGCEVKKVSYNLNTFDKL